MRCNWLKTGHIWITFVIGITKGHSLQTGMINWIFVSTITVEFYGLMKICRKF